MIKKLCSYPGCHKVVEAGVKYCDKHRETDRKKYREYKQRRMRDEQEARRQQFYNSKAWEQFRAAQAAAQLGIDIYEYYTTGRIIDAENYHHIQEITEAWARRLDAANVIGLSEANHRRIHKEYDRSYKAIKKTLSAYAQVDLYPTERNAYKDAKAGKLAVDFGNYGYVLEVHFNSGAADLKGNGRTTGTEIYVTTAEKTVGVETKIVQSIAAMGFKNRGVKRTNFTVIYRAKAAGVSSALLEVCFIDDKDDMSAYAAKKTQIAAAVANAIATQFGLKKGSQEAGSSPATAPATQEIKAGSVVTIKSGAVYGGLSSTRGKAVPAAQLGGKRHTVDKVQTNKGVQEAKLKGINSWVAVASLTAV